MSAPENTVDSNLQDAGTHPLHGMEMTGAEMIVQVIADEDVGVIFGYSGGAILPTYDAVFRFNQKCGGDHADGSLPLIVPANEQGAGFMAAGYSRATGNVGTVMVTSGPGATNMVTPVRDCAADSVPLVVICGQVPRAAIGTDAFQEAPISAVMGSVAKHVFLVTEPEKLEATVRTAYEIARTGRPGPVVIDIPKDVQNWTGHFDGRSRLPVPGYRKRLARVLSNQLRDEQCQSFLQLLAQAERPLIYAGGGVVNSGASAALRQFAERFGLPVTMTLMGLGAADTTDTLSLHMLGMHGTAYANYAVEDCDFLIAVAARFDDRVAGVPQRFAPNARHIAQFDIDASEIDKVKSVSWHYTGSLAQALEAVTEYAERIAFSKDYSAWQSHIGQLKDVHKLNFDRNSALIQPQAVIEAINQRTGGEAVISTGVGQHQMWAAQYFDFREPRLWLTSGSMGTMGFGVPAAIGAQFGRPDRLVIDIDGDASIRMNLGELETVTTYNLPVKIVVLNNYGDGMVRQWQKLYYKGRLAASDKSLHRKDFIAAAKADGFGYAVRLDDPAALQQTVDEFISYQGPAFLEVIIDPDASVYPMVGPGQGYGEMITGEFIVGRDPDDGKDVSQTESF
ncbi:MAG: biosynthetic-type acetolactate synthase large subunit [Pseudomonadota bacterium]